MAMRAAVFYATREGQARRVAERVGTVLRAHRFEVDLFDVRGFHGTISWEAYNTAFVVASVHVGHHEREMRNFVRQYRDRLQALSAAFLSLTLSQAGVQDATAPLQKRDEARADVMRMIDVFAAETGWLPARSLPVAGALAYSQYNVLVRLVMRRIARKAGAPTDTSRDYEFTDWPAVDTFVLAHAAVALAG
jgi:menaquinone-dependent protoporphyrinogen oxidase